MTPEEKARQNIDRQLIECGWIIQDHSQMNIHAGSGVAIREFPLKTGAADYYALARIQTERAAAAKAPKPTKPARSTRKTKGDGGDV